MSIPIPHSLAVSSFADRYPFVRIGQARYWLGNAYIAMNGPYCTNESEKSFLYHLQALEIFNEISSPECDMLATVNYKVGWHYAYRGDLPTAL